MREHRTAPWLVVVAALGLAGAAAAQPTPAQVDEDADVADSLWKQLQELGDPRQVDSPVAGKKGRAYLDALERLEAHRRFYAQHAGVLDAWRGRYAPAARNAYEVKEGMKRAGVPHEAHDKAESILAMRERLPAEVPAQLVEKCLDTLQTFSDRQVLQSLNPMYQVKAIEDARQLLEVCPRFVPGDERVAAKMERLRPRVEEVLAHFQEIERKALEERTWEPGVAGAPKGLAAAAKQWLERSPDWGASRARPMKVLAVAVSRDWFVAERNLLGQPTKWGLPIHAALEKPDLGEGVAQVIELSLLTSGDQKQPPFTGAWVGNTWRILARRVPRP
jgi:hypothetical protein